MTTDLFGVSQRGAVLSDCGRYRYRLWRSWAREDAKRVAWIMLNPSTADAEQDDPTIRRCIGFAKRWGYGGVEVVNLFALRATDPRALSDVADPIGPDNSAWIDLIARRSHQVVAAWGAWPAAEGQARVTANRLLGLGVTLVCLGRTALGAPRHPLYVRSDVTLKAWPWGNWARRTNRHTVAAAEAPPPGERH